jgi:hypothetical protein
MKGIEIFYHIDISIQILTSLLKIQFKSEQSLPPRSAPLKMLCISINLFHKRSFFQLIGLAVFLFYKPETQMKYSLVKVQDS